MKESPRAQQWRETKVDIQSCKSPKRRTYCVNSIREMDSGKGGAPRLTIMRCLQGPFSGRRR